MRIRFKRNNISNGASELKNELSQRGHDAKLIRITGSSFRQRPGDLIVNWGNAGDSGLNWNAGMASDKSRCLSMLAQNTINCPDFTGNMEEARAWLEEGSSVVCRTLTQASSGRGIVIADEESELVAAPLYTRYIKKRDEFRVHVFNGEVIDVQRKARRSSVEDDDVNWRVRTSDNGFVFVRQDVELPEHVKDMCANAVQVCNLDFGAVDIVYNAHRDAYYVLEINTAPGLEGQTIINYADAIERYIGEQN